MTGQCRRPRNGLDGTQICRPVSIAQSGQESANRLKTTSDREAEDTTEGRHLPFRDIMLGMTLKSGIENTFHSLLFLKKPGNRKCILTLLPHTQMQCFHTTEKKIGSHRIKGSPRDFPIVVDAFYEIGASADNPSQGIGMTTEELRRAVDYEVGTQLEGPLVYGRGKGIVNDNNGTRFMG